MKSIIFTLFGFCCFQIMLFGQVPEGKHIGSQCSDTCDHHSIQYENLDGVCCDTTFSFPAPEIWSSGLAWDGEFFWASGYTMPFIYKLDTLGNILDSIPSPAVNGSYGGSLEYDGTFLLCVVEQDGILYKINTTSGAVVQQFDLPSESYDPDNLGCTFDGQYIWNVYHSPNHLYKIDANDGQVLDTFNLSSSIIAIEWINGELYGLNSFFNPTNYLYKISTFDGSYIDSTDWCLNLVSDLSWDGESLWSMTTIGSLNSVRIHKMKDCLPFTTSNVQAVESPSISIHPNPTSDRLTIESENIVEVTVINTKGQVMSVFESTNEIDLKNLPDGIYYLTIETKKEVVTKKVIKN